MNRFPVFTSIMTRLAFLGLTPVVLMAAPPSSCTNDPVVVTVFDNYADPDTSAVYTSALKSDGAGPYVNGTSGVEAVIWSCPGASGDMTLEFGNAKKSAPRSLQLNLGDVVASGPSTPSWATGTIPIKVRLVIGNILFNYSPSQSYAFTTGLAAAGLPNTNYYLRMVNPLKDATGALWMTQTNFNSPCDTAKVVVQHVPAVGSTKESWNVWPDSTAYGTNSGCGNDSMSTPIQVGAIADSRTNYSSAGQYQLPFFIKIQRK